MSPVQPLRPQPGSTIDPRNAVGRQATSARARSELRGGNNLGLNDPRRMGKTVWLDMFCHEPGEGFEALKIDYEGVLTAREFLLRTVGDLSTHRSLPKQVFGKLTALFDNVEVNAGPVTIKPGVATRAPTELLDETIRSVDDHLDDGVVLVIAMDEVPLAIGNIAENEGAASANHVLQTLRGLRRRGSRIRWIVCGSVGFHHILRRCDATEGVVNDLVNLPLGPLTTGEATELAQRLFLGIEREADKDAVAALVGETGGIPFLLHALAHRLYDAGSGPVAAGDVDRAFTDLMDDRDDSRAVTHLVTRMEPFYGDKAAAAEAILDRVAVDLATEAAAFDNRRLLDSLIDDHYLVERDRTIRWRYDVLRRIWAHRRRLG
ncbi:MAG: hypothetical protein M3340_11635 [Actinomycetota bacterium]|nr:hypothetical protein [Actinomycetota bacterium]